MGKRGLVFCVTVLACGLASSAAQAEIGKASAGPGEWFLGLNVGGGGAWGPDHQAYATQQGTEFKSFDFESGAFFSGGVEIGYSFSDPDGLMDRIELNVDLNMLSHDLSRDPGLAILSLGDEFNTSAVIAGGDDTHVDASEDNVGVEIRLSFKNTLMEDEDHSVIASFEPFLRYQNTDSDVDATSSLFNPQNLVSANRRDEVDAEYYGFQLALEMEKPLSETLSLVGRASAGAYYVTSDVESRLERFEVPFGLRFQDSDGTWGGRFGGAFGIKVPLYHTGASFTLLGTVDYMTDVATIDHVTRPAFPPVELTKAGFDDQLELGGKVGLIIPLK